MITIGYYACRSQVFCFLLSLYHWEHLPLSALQGPQLNHFSHRTLVYQNTCQTAGLDGYAAPVVVGIGMAGAANSKLAPTQPDIFVTVNKDTHGYTRIVATPTSFKLQYLEVGTLV